MGRRTESVYILHLSDLHFGNKQNAELWYSQLAEDIKTELECPKLDALIISGDITKNSERSEYEAAKFFLDKVCEEFELRASQLVIVPGNHDLNWKLSKEHGYRLIDREIYNGELEEGRFINVGDGAIRVRDEVGYQKRFQHFRKFYQSVTGHFYPLDHREQAVLYPFPNLNLLILGLNSSWNTDYYFKDRISVCSEALSHALNKIRYNYKGCLKFAVWHHPLNSPSQDRITDHGFMERLASCGFSVCFHGHLHKADAGLYRYDYTKYGRKIHIVSAGTFGAPVKEWTHGYPLQYNFLKLSGNLLTVETRCRRELNGAWQPDSIWKQGKGKDPHPRYAIEIESLNGINDLIENQNRKINEAKRLLQEKKKIVILYGRVSNFNEAAFELIEYVQSQKDILYYEIDIQRIKSETFAETLFGTIHQLGDQIAETISDDPIESSKWHETLRLFRKIRYTKFDLPDEDKQAEFVSFADTIIYPDLKNVVNYLKPVIVSFRRFEGLKSWKKKPITSCCAV